MNHQCDVSAIAAGLGISDKNAIKALNTGIEDGYEQGLELSMGMTYDSQLRQWAYDVGTYIGACLKVRDEK